MTAAPLVWSSLLKMCPVIAPLPTLCKSMPTATACCGACGDRAACSINGALNKDLKVDFENSTVEVERLTPLCAPCGSIARGRCYTSKALVKFCKLSKVDLMEGPVVVSKSLAAGAYLQQVLSRFSVEIQKGEHPQQQGEGYVPVSAATPLLVKELKKTKATIVKKKSKK